MDNNIVQITQPNNCDLKVTSIADLQSYAAGSLVQLPSFGEGQPFIARLRRPSMMMLAKSGKIPNELLVSANALFEGGAASFNVVDENALKRMFEVMDTICEASFVEPTYAQLKEANVELTDEQYMFVFGYAQNGVRQLESFR